MPLPEPPATNESSGLIGQVIKTAERFNQLTTGALVSATGGIFVAALMTGGIAWIAFGAALPLLVFRLHTERLQHAERHRIWLIEEVAAIKESISRREIPEADKRFLLDQLDRELAAQECQALPQTTEQEKP